MCEAEEKWANELFSDGLIEGRIEGHREGIVDLTKRMMTKSDMTLDDAMAHLGLTDDEKQIVRFCLEP